MAKRRWAAADVGRQQDRHVMTEHRCGIRIGDNGSRWPTAGIDPARAIASDRPDAQSAEVPAELNQASKTARSAPNEHRAGQPVRRRRSSPALAQSANPHRDRHTLGPHLPRLRAWALLRRRPAHTAPPSCRRPRNLHRPPDSSRIGRTGHVRKCKLDDAAASRALCGHGDTQLSQANIASMMLTAELVGTTRVKRRPALPRSEAYSDLVRSCPPSCTSMTISSIFPGCGASPGGRTISTISNRLPAFIASRTWPRIVRHRSSLQSWMICERM